MRRVVNKHSLAPLTKRQKAAGIPTAFRVAMLADWDEAKSNPGAQELLRSYMTDRKDSLYIFGPVGTGKSWCGCAIANELLQEGESVKFQSVSGLLLEVRATFSDEGRSELDVLTPLFDANYLVLDELGDIALERERRASDFVVSRLLTLLDRRWQEGKATIMTSNLSPDELNEWVGRDERIGSRLRGMCGEDGIVNLSGRDLRFDSEEKP